VVVVGHTKCGGVDGAIKAAAAGGAGGADSALMRYLGPLTKIAEKVKSENPSLDGAELQAKVEEENVKAQVENIVQTDVLKSNWKGEPSPLKPELKNKVAVHG
jgi:carbonic anhydrase